MITLVCECGCGHQTAGGHYLPGHNIVAHYAATDKTALFWSRVKKQRGDACWLWIARSHSPFGYGIMRWRGIATPAHRIAYELTYGPISEGLSVLHECDNPPCCNPKHLKLGSQSDNMRGAAIRKRMPSDISHHRAKPIQFYGKQHTAHEWARRLKLPKHALLSRLKRGWSVERALTTPVRSK